MPRFVSRLNPGAVMAQIRRREQAIVNRLAERTIELAAPPVTPRKTGHLAESEKALPNYGDRRAAAYAGADYAYWVHRKKPFLSDSADRAMTELPAIAAEQNL